MPLPRCSFICGSLIACSILSSCPAFARTPATTRSADSVMSMDRKDHGLEGYVITGQYAPGTVTKAVHKVRVVDRKKIDAMNAQNLRDVLSNELSIQLTQDNSLGSGMSMQGVSGQNVKILIDGVPVIGRLEGNIDLSQINLYDIERIEIIEGPMSVTYGTDALAGTINLITRKSQSHGLETGFNSYYESIGTYNLNAHAGFRHKAHLVKINGGRYFFDGWNAGDRQFDLNYAARPADNARYKQWKPKEQYFGDVQYNFSFRKTALRYRGSYFNELITNRGLPRGPYGENSLDDRYRTIRQDHAVFAEHSFSKDRRLQVQASYNHYTRHRNTNVTDLTTLESVPSLAAGDQDTSLFGQFNSRGTFSSAAAAHKLHYELGYDINLENATGLRIKDGAQHIGDYALFASAEYTPVKGLKIRPGFRYAYNTVFNAPVVPGLHVRYELRPDLVLRASYAKGFRAPTLKELYFEFVDVNHNISGSTDLKPEYSDNYNAHATYSIRRGGVAWTVDGGFFYNNIRDLISLAETGPNAVYSYINVGHHRTRGGQLQLESRYRNLKAGIGGSYIGRYNDLSADESVAAPVARFSYTPEVRANIMYTFAGPEISAALFYKYTGRMPGFSADAAGNISATDIDAYQMADLSISRSFLNKMLTVSTGCKNLFDVKQVNRLAPGASGGTHTTGGGSLPVGTGRMYFLRLQFNFHN